MEKLESFYTLEENVKWHGGSLNRIKIALPYDPTNSLLGIYQKELKSGSLWDIWTHVHCCTIHNSQDVEKNWMSIKELMHTENVVNILSGIFFNVKKEINPDMCDNMEECLGHYAKWNKSVTVKKKILHDAIYYDVYKIFKQIEAQSKLVVSRGLGRGKLAVAIQQGWNFSYARWLYSTDLLYNIASIINYIILYT